MMKVGSKTLGEQIAREIDISWKQRNAARLHYYKSINWDARAIASYEDFVGSWAHSMWIKQHRDEIDRFVDEQLKRFGVEWTR